MATNGRRSPNQTPSSAGLGSIFVSIMGPMPDTQWEDGPKYRGTNTPVSSRKTCFDGEEGGMIPSPLGRGLPSRHGYGKSY